MKCKACSSAAYCGRNCQRSHWPAHKPRCKAIRKSHNEMLWHAAGDGDFPTVRAQLAAGADAGYAQIGSGGTGGFTVVYMAAESGYREIVRYLVEEQGASYEETSDDGQTPLSGAAAYGRLEVVRYLVERAIADDCADYINRARENLATPIYIAAMKHNEAVVRLLGDAGADLDRATDLGSSPMYTAAYAGDLGILQYLLDKGADPNNIHHVDGGTPLLAAAQAGNLDCVRAIVEVVGANRVADNTCSALYAAAQNGHISTVKYLAGQGADLEYVVQTTGMSALSVAASLGRLACVEHLARCGANLLATSSPTSLGLTGVTALHCAIGRRQEHVVQLLSDIIQSGGWGPYVVARRLPHYLLRHRVAMTLATVPVGHDDRELFHFLFGRNNSNTDADAAAAAAAAAAATEDPDALAAQLGRLSIKELKANARTRGISLAGCLEKRDIVAAVAAAPPPTPVRMLTVPDALFDIVMGFLVN